MSSAGVPTTFVFVPGAWHDASSWRLLREVLHEGGHATVAVDLPEDDPEAGGEAYRDVTLRAMDGVDGGVVLVAHSLAGLVIPLVAETRPVDHMVFLCAFLPVPGRSFLETVDRDGPGVFSDDWPELQKAQVAGGDGSSWWTEEGAIEAFYLDCDPQVARAAAAALGKQYWKALDEPSPLEAWPNVPSTYILGKNDRVVNPAWSRVAARERLGVEAIELPSQHSPMLSHPHEVAAILTEVEAST